MGTGPRAGRGRVVSSLSGLAGSSVFGGLA